MHRDHRLYLDDILEAIAKIRKYTAGLDYAAFAKDSKTQDAVVRNLEIIGEEAGHLPDSIQAALPEIEWRKIIGLRNILAHVFLEFEFKIKKGLSFLAQPFLFHMY